MEKSNSGSNFPLSLVGPQLWPNSPPPPGSTLATLAQPAAKPLPSPSPLQPRSPAQRAARVDATTPLVSIIIYLTTTTQIPHHATLPQAHGLATTLPHPKQISMSSTSEPPHSLVPFCVSLISSEKPINTRTPAMKLPWPLLLSGQMRMSTCYSKRAAHR